MPYQVSYKSDTIPTDLPEGASVEKISLLPLEVRTDLDRIIEVEDGGHDETYLTVRETGAYSASAVCAALPDDIARQIAHALLESIGEDPAKPAVAIGKLVKSGTKVRTMFDLPYTSVKAGEVGEVEYSDADIDDEYYVRFEDAAEYVHFSKLALA